MFPQWPAFQLTESSERDLNPHSMPGRQVCSPLHHQSINGVPGMQTLISLESRWTGFEPITTASQTKKLLLKSRTGSVFQRSAKLSYHRRLKMSDSNRSSASLTQRATLLHHILSNNPSGNRTRASGATVRRTYRYTMRLYFVRNDQFRSAGSE